MKVNLSRSPGEDCCINPDFAIEGAHNYAEAIQMASSIKLIMNLELFFETGPLKTFLSQHLRTEKITISRRLRDEDIFNGSSIYF
jgi:hypothetical protein